MPTESAELRHCLLSTDCIRFLKEANKEKQWSQEVRQQQIRRLSEITLAAENVYLAVNSSDRPRSDLLRSLIESNKQIEEITFLITIKTKSVIFGASFKKKKIKKRWVFTTTKGVFECHFVERNCKKKTAHPVRWRQQLGLLSITTAATAHLLCHCFVLNR